MNRASPGFPLPWYAVGPPHEWGMIHAGNPRMAFTDLSRLRRRSVHVSVTPLIPLSTHHRRSAGQDAMLDAGGVARQPLGATAATIARQAERSRIMRESMKRVPSLLLGVALLLAPAASHAISVSLPTNDLTLNLGLQI